MQGLLIVTRRVSVSFKKKKVRNRACDDRYSWTDIGDSFRKIYRKDRFVRLSSIKHVSIVDKTFHSYIPAQESSLPVFRERLNHSLPAFRKRNAARDRRAFVCATPRRRVERGPGTRRKTAGGAKFSARSITK